MVVPYVLSPAISANPPSSHVSDCIAVSKRFKGLPVLGAFHATDILNVYGGGDMTDYLVNFVNNLDPNGVTGIHWPQYSLGSRELLMFQDGLIPLTITTDDYRVDGFNVITDLSLKFPI